MINTEYQTCIGEDHHFLSQRDKQFIEMLAHIGYEKDAARLVEKAYKRRSQEVVFLCSSVGAHMDDGHPLFTLFHMEYLEMLLTVGQKERATRVANRLMNEYRRSLPGGIVSTSENQSELDKEFTKTILAIETTGSLPPEETDGPRTRDSSPASSFLRSLLRSVTRRN